MKDKKANSGELLRDTLDMLVLKTLTRGPMHGYGIAEFIEEATDDMLRVEEGALYPALHRLEQNGWIDSEWKDTDLGRSAKFYALTREGKQQLERELDSWNRLSSAVGLLLRKA